MTDLGGFGQCKRQEMCHEGRALLDLLDWSKNFDLGIRNQLFFYQETGGRGAPLIQICYRCL